MTRPEAEHPHRLTPDAVRVTGTSLAWNTATGLAIFGILLLTDRLPRFFQGDSIAYLSTGMNGWIPPDRSWAYGFGTRWLVEATRSASALVVTQAVLLLMTILAMVRVFAGKRHGRIMGVGIVMLLSLDPLNQTYARFWLSDTVAEVAYFGFVTLLACSLSGRRRRSVLALMFICCLVTIFVRVAYAPVVVVMLLIAAACASLTPHGDRPRGLRRQLIALCLMPVLAGGMLAAANSQVSLNRLHGQVFLNRMSGLYTLGVFLPGIRIEDFARAGVTVTRDEFDGLHLDRYDNRGSAVWSEGPQYIRSFLQKKLGVEDYYDARFQATCSAILRSAVLHHPQTILLTYAHALALYLNPIEWTSFFPSEMGFGRELPSWVATYLTDITGHAIGSGYQAQKSLLPSILGRVIGWYPLLLLAGVAASVWVLVANRSFGTRHILSAALLASLLVAPLFSHMITPRYLLATVMLSELLIGLQIGGWLQARAAQRRAATPPDPVMWGAGAADPNMIAALRRPRPSNPLVSLVVPVFNEAAAIPPFLDQVWSGVVPASTRLETIFVNDGSTDATLPLLLAHAAGRPDLRVVNLSRNFGKEAAMTAGLDQAGGDAVVLIDVDLQDPPELLADFITLWQQGYDVVYGLRQSRDGDGRMKVLTAGLFYRFFNGISATPIPHNVGDFRLIDRRVVDALQQMPERGRFMKGLFAWVGFSSIAVPYARPPRRHGQTKWNYWRLWNFALDGIVSFSTAPLRIWTYFGAVIALGAVCYAAFIALRVLLLGTDVPGYASLIMVMLFSTAANLVSLGMIGEYVSRLFVETKQRPIYLLEGIYPAPADMSPPHGS